MSDPGGSDPDTLNTEPDPDPDSLYTNPNFLFTDIPEKLIFF